MVEEGETGAGETRGEGVEEPAVARRGVFDAVQFLFEVLGAGFRFEVRHQVVEDFQSVGIHPDDALVVYRGAEGVVGVGGDDHLVHRELDVEAFNSQRGRHSRHRDLGAVRPRTGRHHQPPKMRHHHSLYRQTFVGGLDLGIYRARLRCGLQPRLRCGVRNWYGLGICLIHFLPFDSRTFRTSR